jgi:hypothetical protein
MHLNVTLYVHCLSYTKCCENSVIAELCWCKLVTSICLLQEYLSFRHGHVASSKLNLESPESAVERVLEPPLDEMVAAHLRLVMN